MEKLSDYPNIGSVLEKQLSAVGITTMDQLRDVGSRQAWLKIKAIDASACIHRLLSLEGAIQDVRKTQLPEETKRELKEFYQAMK